MVMVNYFIKHYESDSSRRVLLISKDGQFKFCSISVYVEKDMNCVGQLKYQGIQMKHIFHWMTK